MKYGLVHNDSPFASDSFVPIDDMSVMDARSTKQLPDGSFLSEYIPFYFGPRSPMLYNIQNGNGILTKKEPDTFRDVQKFLANEENKPYEDICKKTANFLSGYYSNYLLELLSTVDFILHNNDDLKEWLIMKPQEVFELVVLHINQWSERKKYLFNNEEYVRLVLNHLYMIEK